jgi:branched-chain amino acid aminotransferase
VALSGLQDAYVEFICTRGTSPTFSRDPRDSENRFIAFAIPFGSVANEEQRRRGLNLAVTDVLRIPPASLDPTVKNYHWLDMVKALYAGYAIEADSAVLVDQEGNLSEGPGFNIFAVQDGKISTPKGSVLHGITRQTIFDICADQDIPCEEHSIPVDVLKAADEVFITSTAGGVMAATRLDGQVVGEGMIGPITEQITKRYWDMHSDARYASAVMYPEHA